MTILDGSVAVLHGSADNSLRWMWLSPKLGTTTIARLDGTGFFLRQYDAPGVSGIAQALPMLWARHVEGCDLSAHATHQLQAPQMQHIVPIDEFGTEAML